MSQNKLEIFADELDGVLVGYPISKIRFVSTMGIDDDGNQITEKVLTIAMPTEALIKACMEISKNAENDMGMLLEMAEESATSLRKAIQVNAQNKPAIKVKKSK